MAHPIVDFDVAMEIASHEAVVRQTYKDGGGVLTWSVGLTSNTGHKVGRYIGKPQTIQHCMNVYVWALENYAAGVRRAFAGYKLTKAQFTAANSFHWNTGAIERASWVKHWKTGDMVRARKSFVSWNRPASIIGRRKKEADLMFKGIWSNRGTMTEYTRVTTNLTPIWGSAKIINVKAEIMEAFRKNIQPPLDHAPIPDSKPVVPTLSPPDMGDRGQPDDPGVITPKPEKTALVAFLEAAWRVLSQLFRKR